jgi:hypothetical protein
MFIVLFVLLFILLNNNEKFNNSCNCDDTKIHTECDKSDICPKCCHVKKAHAEDLIKNNIDPNDGNKYCKCVKE